MGNVIYGSGQSTNASIDQQSNKEQYFVFSSGGIKGLAFCGALKKYNLSNVRGYAGTSAGAIYASLLAVGYTPDELEEIMMNVDVNKLLDGHLSYIREAINLYKRYGEVPGENFYNFLGELIEKKTGNPNYTIEQLKKDKDIDLRVVAIDISLGKEVKFSCMHAVKEYREIPIRLAVRMSMSIPFIFEPVLYNGSYFVDGALVNGFPYNIFKNVKTVNSVVTGFLIMGESDNNALNNTHKTEITCFMDYASANINSVLLANTRKKLKKHLHTGHIIKIITKDYSLGKFDLTSDEKLQLIKDGELAVDPHT